MILYRNCFGTVIGGSHPEIHEETIIEESCSNITAIVMHATQAVETFFETESWNHMYSALWILQVWQVSPWRKGNVIER
jgi:hypothetical protein